MPTKISHIVIPLENKEEIDKAKDFFVNVIGLHVREGMDKLPPVSTVESVWTERGRRLPDHAIHLMDDSGTFVDLVAYDDRPVCYARGVGSGKGLALAFQVDDIKKTWARLEKEDYPVSPIADPEPYPDWATKSMGKKEAYYAFCSLKMGRVSDDGEEQIIELVQWK